MVAFVASIAVLLSIVGIYALMSFTVAQRTREIGIRAALGANPRQIVTTILSRAAAQLGAGVIAGVLVAALFGVLEPGDQMARDPVVLTVSVLMMMLVGFLSCVVPAVRGLRIEPTEALRQRP